MNKVLMAVLLIAIASCKSKSNEKNIDSSSLKFSGTEKSNGIKGSNYSKKSVDSLIRAGAISPDSIPDAPPSQSEERERLKRAYSKIEIIDSSFISNGDTLHFYLKYYCLKDSNLVIPAFYDSEGTPPRSFTTHPFVAYIWLTNKGDTVLKKQFKASDFNPFFKDNFGGNLKKYGSILDAYLPKRNKDKSQITVFVSLSIPTTDLGIGMDLIISKNGSYKIVANY